MVKIGNIYYFLYIIIGFTYFFILYFILRNKKKKTKKKVLQIILFCNLGLHFAKLFFEPYRLNLPTSIRKVTFENICAVSTLIFPFIYLGKKENSIWKNYMYFIGFLGGFGALFYPTEAINKKPFTFDCIRFYICHMTLVFIPLLSVLLDVTKVDYKKFWKIPFIFLAIELLILINELILIKIGFVSSSTQEFFDRNIRNSSFVFGLTSAFDGVKPIIMIFVPKIFTIDYFGINNGIDFYWPVIWMLIPALVYLPIVYLFITLPFTYKYIINDWRNKKC